MIALDDGLRHGRARGARRCARRVTVRSAEPPLPGPDRAPAAAAAGAGAGRARAPCRRASQRGKVEVSLQARCRRTRRTRVVASRAAGRRRSCARCARCRPSTAWTASVTVADLVRFPGALERSTGPRRSTTDPAARCWRCSSGRSTALERACAARRASGLRGELAAGASTRSRPRPARIEALSEARKARAARGAARAGARAVAGAGPRGRAALPGGRARSSSATTWPRSCSGCAATWRQARDAARRRTAPCGQAARLPGPGAGARGQHGRQQGRPRRRWSARWSALKAEIERLREQVQNVE